MASQSPYTATRARSRDCSARRSSEGTLSLASAGVMARHARAPGAAGGWARACASRRPALSGRYFDTVDPATATVITQVAEGDAADIDAAVKAARAAFEGEWGHLRAADRGLALLRLADLIRAKAQELAAGKGQAATPTAIGGGAAG